MRSSMVAALAVSSVVLASSAAFAQDEATQPTPAAQPAPAAPTTAAPAGGSLDDVRYHDANMDRVVLGSTAETHPKGTFFVSDYEIFLLEIGYALTDELQVQLTGLLPIVKNQPYWFDLGAKYNLYRGDVFRAALTGAFDIVTIPGNVGSGAQFGGRIGAVGQFCFDPHCRSSLSPDVGTIITSAASQVLPIYGSVGLILNVSPLVSFLAEPALLSALGAGSGDINNATFFAFDYGVRLAGNNFGLDLTFLEPVAATSGSINNPFVIGYPFIAATYRTDGDAAKQAGSALSKRFTNQSL